MRDAKERLRPLDRIDPPDVWHRATRLEPVGDVPPAPQPSWQARVAAGTVAFAVFAGAVALVLGAFGRGEQRSGIATTPRTTDAVVIQLDGTDEGATATVEYDGTSMKGYGLSYCWGSGDTSRCADAVPPTNLAGYGFTVEPNHAIEVIGNAESVTIEVLEFPLDPYVPVDGIELHDGVGTLPSDPGSYVLSVAGSWPNGERTFYFGLTIVASGGESSPEPSANEPNEPTGPIEVTTPARGDDVTSPVTIAGTADVFEATVSIQIFDQTNNPIADTFATATCGTGCRGDFSIEVPYSVGSVQEGTIHVFEVSAMDGSKTNVVRIPVTLHPGPQDPVASAIEGVWSDADGNPLADGTMHVFEGPDHCGWTSATFVHVAWPLGSVAQNADDVRQYIRDPGGLFDDRLRMRSGSSGSFPADAEPTGIHRGGWELWLAPSDQERAIYGVTGDPRNGGTWERWPRAVDMIGCL